ncbi:MAG: hypothetical protein RL291_133 [Pseudomonadota bacterium]
MTRIKTVRASGLVTDFVLRPCRLCGVIDDHEGEFDAAHLGGAGHAYRVGVLRRSLHRLQNALARLDWHLAERDYQRRMKRAERHQHVDPLVVGRRDRE